MKISVRASSRLHLGFLDLNGNLGRLYGSVGVSLSNPATQISITEHDSLIVKNCQNKTQEKVLDIISILAKRFGFVPKFKLSLDEAIPAHMGLGSGTQLAMAIAKGVTRFYEIKVDLDELAVLLKRGKRSSIGIRGFESGGLVIDAGKKTSLNQSHNSKPATRIFRFGFPLEWEFVLVVCRKKQGLSGKQEKAALKLVDRSEKISKDICRLVMMNLIPSLLERDIDTFGKAMTRLDQRTGMFFVPAQKGIYSQGVSERIIERFLLAGAKGAGQSSWGPCLYGLTHKNDTADLVDNMQDFLKKNKINGRVFSSRANNVGAEIKVKA